MANPLRESSQAANQMTAASLPYVFQGAGGGAVEAGLQAAQVTQNMVMRQAEQEVMLQTYQARTQLMHAELDLRQRLAPLQYQEAEFRLRTLQLEKQIREFELGQQKMSFDMLPAIGTPESGFQIAVGPGRYVDADPSNPRHAQAIQMATMRTQGAQAEIDRTRAQTEELEARKFRPWGSNKELDLVDDIRAEKSDVMETLRVLHTNLSDKSGKKPEFQDWLAERRKAGDPMVKRMDQLTERFDQSVGIGQETGDAIPPLFRNQGTGTVALSFLRNAGIPQTRFGTAHDQIVLDARKKLEMQGLDPNDHRALEAAAISLMQDPAYLEGIRMEFNVPQMGR